ncbi:MAG: DUF4827 domain-containing protein [Prevotella sp.]|nr:DUF4827 domain-containing protein [Prevotella sp.]
MKQPIYVIIYALLIVTVMASCKKEETYAEQREREISSINNFISKNKIQVISEQQFIDQGYVTEEAQYVKFNNTGVYMNIIDKGPIGGTILANGKSEDVLVRYQEYNLKGDSIKTTNRTPTFANLCDKFSVRNNSGTFVASFVYGVMRNTYKSTSVPGGWLIPLKYIRLGRIIEDEDRYATVRLIVPHEQGTAAASTGVYACYYYMEYQADR